MTQVGVLGLGAIGHLVAAQFLEKSGVQLHFFTRRDLKQFRFLSDTGQKVEQPIHCITSAEPLSLDWLFICLKAYHYDTATPWFEHLIDSKTKVVVLRNGLDLSTPLLPYTKAEQILPCLVDAPTQYDPSTQAYVQQAQARFGLPQHPLAKTLKDFLATSAIEVDINFDFKTASWEKLIESASLGAILCLTGQPCRILKQPSIRSLYQKALAEAVQVALADGAKIRPGYVEDMLKKGMSYPAEKGSSMLSDRLAGRPIEVMAKSGIISEKARALGIMTPLHDTFTSLLSGINS